MSQRRGRRSREDQLEQAILLFRQELIILEDDETFGECRGVQAMIRHLARETLKHGTALDLLIQGAVADVTSDLYAAETPQAQRLAQFLHLWFRERKSVIEIAAVLHLDRSYVGRAIKGPALTLVAQRFLSLAQQEDPAEESQGVQEARLLHERRRSRATERLTVMHGPQSDVWESQQTAGRRDAVHSHGVATTS